VNTTLRLTARQIRESVALYVRVHGYPAAVDDVTLLHDPERNTVVADVTTTVVDPPPTNGQLPTGPSSATR
jgi:hypothetical protein